MKKSFSERIQLLIVNTPAKYIIFFIIISFFAIRTLYEEVTQPPKIPGWIPPPPKHNPNTETSIIESKEFQYLLFSAVLLVMLVLLKWKNKNLYEKINEQKSEEFNENESMIEKYSKEQQKHEADNNDNDIKDKDKNEENKANELSEINKSKSKKEKKIKTQ